MSHHAPGAKPARIRERELRDITGALLHVDRLDAETGTRGLLGATIGAADDRDEAGLAVRLLPLLAPGMLVLLDRGFDSAAFLGAVHRTGAMLLARGRSQRVPPVLTHLPDGSYLSQLDGLTVRIIEADLAMSGTDGTAVTDHYRLITTLLDADRFPAEVLIRLYHERWEIESAYLALRHTMLAGHVLRSGDRAGLEQEVWALLTLYQLLRMAMTTAVETRPGTNPDRASFTSALQTARDQLTAAAGVCPHPDEPVDLLGVIGRAVLATLLPARRARYSARKVKCATSRYLHRDDTRPAASTTVAGIVIRMQAPPPLDPARSVRFTLELGAGENLNEHVVGRGWPPVNLRHEMLAEAVPIIRGLLEGGYVNHAGQHFRVDSAKAVGPPPGGVPIAVAVSGEQSIEGSRRSRTRWSRWSRTRRWSSASRRPPVPRCR